MSVYNIKSKVLANRDAVPSVLSNPEIAQGLLKGTLGVERTGAAIIDAASTIRLFTMPSNARLHSLEYAAQGLGTSALDIAVWYPTTIPQGGLNAPAASLAGTLVSSSAFGANIAGVDTGIAWTDGMGLPSVLSIPKRSQQLWQMLGLSTDPSVDLDFGFTVRTATSVQGYVGMRASYVD